MSRETKLDGGKYTVIRGDDGSLGALRYGEPWRDLTGDKLVGALVIEVEELRAKTAGTTNQADFQKHLFNVLHEELTFQGDDSSRDVWEALGKALAVAPHEWDTADHHGNEELGLWPPGAR